MIAPLGLTITNAGMAKFAAAQLATDIDLTITTVGVSAATFIVAPTLTALPGETRRIATISGATIAPDTIHLMVRDASAETYTVRAFGLFLADGTLFAVYGQPAILVEKSAGSVTLFALDLRFPRDQVAEIRFGDANFLNPPASETVIGVAAVATADEVDAATSDQRFVTPLKLGQRLMTLLAGYLPASMRGTADGVASLGPNGKIPPSQISLGPTDVNAVPTSRRILTSGLASGGGGLDEDRTVGVPAATQHEVQLGERGDRAVTPFSLTGGISLGIDAGEYVWPGGLRIKWGRVATPLTSEGQTRLDFPTPFPNACAWVEADIVNSSGSVSGDTQLQELGGSLSIAGITFVVQSDAGTGNAGSSGSNFSDAGGGYRWRAWGY